MVNIPFAETPSASVGFVNPDSTEHEESAGRLAVIRRHLLHPFHRQRDVVTLASPEDIAEIAESTLVYSGGGDGTLRRVAGAIIGLVPNNPEATHDNEERYSKLAKHVLLFAGADGNACNWALSAHGKYARHPEQIPYARRIWVGQHHPLMYEITDENGTVVSSDIATSGFGLGGAADAGADLQAAKPRLNEMSSVPRLLTETNIALGDVLRAPAFSAAVSLSQKSDPEPVGSFELPDITGLELVGSRVYAKQGLTKVNIDDTYWQPVATRRLPNPVANTALFVETMARVKLGQHIIKPLDFDALNMSIQLTSAEPVRYHADGETGKESYLQPGQTMRLYLAHIAIPTLMIA